MPDPSHPSDPPTSVPRIPSDLSERLRKEHGEDIDPGVTLTGAGPEPKSTTPILPGPPSQPGQRYSFEGEIARGGMGAVLAVHDQDLRRRLAMKVILTNADGSVDTAALGRFLEEAQVTAQLDHPGVVPVHELGLDESGQVYFTMKMVKGQDLRAVLEKVRAGDEEWTLTRVLHLLLRVCEALAFAHSKGVLHRDLKPANIMVGRFGEVYVMDWGVARVQGQPDRKDLRLRPAAPQTSIVRSDRHAQAEAEESPDQPLLTMDGDVVGTPAYMPIEQAEGRLEDLGPESDVYSLGAILYELLAQQQPYVTPGARLSARTILHAVLQGPPRPLEKLAPDRPPELIAICNKAMARDKQGRYASTEDLASDLRAFLEDRVVLAHRTGPVVQLRKWMQRNTGLAAALAAGLLLLAGLGGTAAVTVATREHNHELDQANLALDEANAKLATKNQQLDLTIGTLDERNLLLGDLKILQELQQDERQLWPAREELVGAMDAWLDQARDLLQRTPQHEDELKRLRTEAAPVDDELVAEALRRSDRRQEYLDAEAVLGEQAAAGIPGSGRLRPPRLKRLMSQIEAEARATVRWRFPESPEKQWRHDNLSALVKGARELAESETGLLAAMQQRRQRAHSIEDSTIGEHFEAWDEARHAIATDHHYGGLELPRQVGLVPLAADPTSGRWEFWHVESGAKPDRDPESGRLIMGEDAGIVMVLIPGGEFWMGADRNPFAPNNDPGALSDEVPPHQLSLLPYLISKFELTQGQWARLSGRRPSTYAAGQPFRGTPILDNHPVTDLSWHDCQEVLPRYGLQLPTEAQWEGAARAGSSTPWWCGDWDSIVGPEGIAGNVFDEASIERGAAFGGEVPEPWDDGHTVHAPVGSFRPNAHGLYDIIGNVWEWCADAYRQSAYTQPASPQDGHRLLLGQLYQGPVRNVVRGGSFYYASSNARSARRDATSPSDCDPSIGVRPVWRLTAK